MNQFSQEIAPARQHNRVTIDVSVRVFADSFVPTLGRTQDLSSAGMSFYTPLDLALGSEVRLAFTLPMSRFHFGLKAIVRNREGFRYGVEFVALASAERAEIERITGLLALAA